MVPWNPARTKVQIRLSIQRLRTLQEKKLALAKKSRRDIADLLAKGRGETARLRVEGLIQDDIYVELLELLELYAETLQARFNLLDASAGTEPEASISDAVCAIVYAAPRTELKELHVLREMLMHKYGRPFALGLVEQTPPPASVPPRVLSKLALFTPGKELVDAYLGEIARGYGVAREPDAPISSEGLEPLKREVDDGGVGGQDGGEGSGSGDGSDGGGGGGKEAPVAAPPAGPAGGSTAAQSSQQPSGAPPKYSPPEKQEKADKPGNEDEELAKRFERLKNLR